MNKKLTEIIQRREALVARSAAQRAAVAAIARQWRRPLEIFDVAVRTFRAARRHPVLTALAAILLARTRYARYARRIGYAVTAWRVFRALSYREAPAPVTAP